MLEEQIRVRLHLIDRIVSEVDLRYGNRFRTAPTSGYSWEHGNQFDVAQEAAGALGSVAEEEAILGVQGPKLAAASLHPWVWKHAAAYWDNGHRRAAIQEAATAIFDIETPAKLKRQRDRTGGRETHRGSDGRESALTQQGS